MLYEVLVRFCLALAIVLLTLVSGCSHKIVAGKYELENSAEQLELSHADENTSDGTIPTLTIDPVVDSVALNHLPKPAHLLSDNAAIPVKDTTSTVALYTVVAHQVPLKEILDSIARDASAKVSIVGDIKGDITISMVEQPLDFILDEISSQVPLRYKLAGQHLVLMEDKPFVRTYEVDYLNMQRISESRVDLATQVGSIRTSIDAGAAAQSGTNGSRLFVENKTENMLWLSLRKSIAGILGDLPATDAAVDENIFFNPEAGIITVRARQSEHRSIATLLSGVLASAQRQVLIEATVVEVALSDRFESGVDWKVLNGFDQSAGTDGSVDYGQVLGGYPRASEALAPSTALLSYDNPDSALGDLSVTLKLLQQFGEVQVLSSPKIIAMNNQPAVLKVVDNRVYFTFEVDRLQRENGDERTVVDSTVHSVPVGLVMNVTPFISKTDEVILNVRPTISRILNFAEDPSPALAGQSQIRNLIPEIQVREMESLLRVQSGEVAIIGGLMQNKVDNRSEGVPGLKRLPWLGKLFSRDTKTLEKTELLVFLRPTVVPRSDGATKIGAVLPASSANKPLSGG